VLFLWFRVAEVHSERERERERIWGFVGDYIGEFCRENSQKIFVRREDLSFCKIGEFCRENGLKDFYDH
jgi:hypothetical protein